MKIKLYYKWPKLSSLNIGDKIKVKENGFNHTNSRTSINLKAFNGKMVTIQNITHQYIENMVTIKEFNDGLYWFINRFEIDEN